MKRKRILMGCLLLGMSLFLLGCGSEELENRKFPLAMAIDKDVQKGEGEKSSFRITMGYQNLSEVADEKAKDGGNAPTETEEISWYEAFEESDESNPKKIDYNHLKAVIISEDLLEDKRMLGEFLDFVKEQEVFARNTLLFTSENDASEILKTEGKLEMPVGTWLEELSAGSREQKDSAIVTLGSLLNEYENRMENLYVPVLTAREDSVKITQYHVISAYENQGDIKKDVFRHAMLLEGKLEQFDMELSDGEAIRLSGIRVEKSYRQEDDEILLQLKLLAEASVLNERITTESERQELKTEIENTLQKELQYDADRLLSEKQVDIANSFYSLGGYDRELYRTYENDISAYRNHLRIEIITEITPVIE